MIEKIHNYLVRKKKEREILQPVKEVIAEIEKYLGEKVTYKPFKIGGGYSTKYLVTSSRGDMLLQIANSHSEERMKSNRPFYVHNYKQRFEREYQILYSMSELNLSPKPIRLGEYYLLREYPSGTTFEEFIKSTSTLDEKLVIFEKVLEGIRKLYEFNFFSSDLSPSNILINNGEVKFIDFEMYREDLSPEEQLLEELRWILVKISQWVDVTPFVDRAKTYFDDFANIVIYDFLVLPEEYKGYAN